MCRESWRGVSCRLHGLWAGRMMQASRGALKVFALDVEEHFVMVLFHRRTPLTLAGALLLSSLILVQPLPAQEQSPGQHRAWKVKESATRLWIENGMLVSATGQAIAEPISLSNIKVLNYETISEQPALGMIEASTVGSFNIASGSGAG